MTVAVGVTVAVVVGVGVGQLLDTVVKKPAESDKHDIAVHADIGNGNTHGTSTHCAELPIGAGMSK